MEKVWDSVSDKLSSMKKIDDIEEVPFKEEIKSNEVTEKEEPLSYSVSDKIISSSISSHILTDGTFSIK